MARTSCPRGLPVVTYMTGTALLPWTVVMPVKVLARAKSRLAGLAGQRRCELALALASDTVSATVACPEVARVLVVTSDAVAGPRLAALGADVVGGEPRGATGGLNAALHYGASMAASRWPGGGIAALAADLPALQSAELGRALRGRLGRHVCFRPGRDRGRHDDVRVSAWRDVPADVRRRVADAPCLVRRRRAVTGRRARATA